MESKDKNIVNRQIVAGLSCCMGLSEEIVQTKLMIRELFPERHPTLQIKSLIVNPVTLNKHHVQQNYPWQDFIVQKKIDGQRVLLVLRDKAFIVSDANTDIIPLAKPLPQTAVLECEVF